MYFSEIAIVSLSVDRFKAYAGGVCGIETVEHLGALGYLEVVLEAIFEGKEHLGVWPEVSQ